MGRVMAGKNVVITPKLWRTLSAVRAVLAKNERRALDEIVCRGTGGDTFSGETAGRDCSMAIRLGKVSKVGKADQQVQAHAFRKAGKAGMARKAGKADKQAQAHLLRKPRKAGRAGKADKQAQAHLLRKPRKAGRAGKAGKADKAG
jgi:hypothetical protein